MTKTFSKQDFISAIKEDAFEETGKIELVGLVKKAGEEDMILFARPGDCGSWVSIPASMIAEEPQPQQLNTVSCEDHSHPVVRFYLNAPAEENVEAQVFAALAHRRPRDHRLLFPGAGRVRGGGRPPSVLPLLGRPFGNVGLNDVDDIVVSPVDDCELEGLMAELICELENAGLPPADRKTLCDYARIYAEWGCRFSRISAA